jgi:hypothetical protein
MPYAIFPFWERGCLVRDWQVALRTVYFATAGSPRYKYRIRAEDRHAIYFRAGRKTITITKRQVLTQMPLARYGRADSRSVAWVIVCEVMLPACVSAAAVLHRMNVTRLACSASSTTRVNTSVDREDPRRGLSDLQKYTTSWKALRAC